MKHSRELKSDRVDLRRAGPSSIEILASTDAIREIRAFMMTNEEAAIDTPYGPVVGSKETIEALQLVLMQPAKPKPKPIPFDLEAAKAGAPLVTRDGRKVDELHHFTKEGSQYPVCAIIGGVVKWCTVDGEGRDRSMDLFMAPKPKRTVWVNIYNNRQAAFFDSEKDAREYYNSAHALTVAVPVEIEA